MKSGLNNKENFNIYPSILITMHRNTIQNNELLHLILINNQEDKRQNCYPIWINLITPLEHLNWFLLETVIERISMDVTFIESFSFYPQA